MDNLSTSSLPHFNGIASLLGALAKDKAERCLAARKLGVGHLFLGLQSDWMGLEIPTRSSRLARVLQQMDTDESEDEFEAEPEPH
eukprot:s130_g37.t1